MRYVLSLVVLLVAAAGGYLAYQHFTAGPPVVLPAPHRLQVSVDGTALSPGDWASSHSVALNATAPSNVVAGADVEVRPAGRRFTGKPTAASTAGARNVTCGSNTGCAASSHDPGVVVRLADGHYHWQVRLHNKRGVSPWVAYSVPINVDATPPSVPQISSPTDPHPGTLYHSSTLHFDWQAADAGSGITGYSYRLDSDPHGTARTDLRTATSSVTLAGLDTGSWYFHVRALDRAGNWGPSATFPVRINVTPPGLAHVRFNAFQFDPHFNSLRVSFAVTRPARTIRVGVYDQRSDSLVRLYTLSGLTGGQRETVTWDGKDTHGRQVAAGSYKIYIRAIDRYGHSSLTGWNDFVIEYRRIIVNLGQQRLWAYDGSRLLLTSLVTTGNRALPTPKGTFTIMAKFHPFTFRSPWPKSSRFYYPPSKVQYAMLFQQGGYYIHDAPWRSAFGPGTNAQVGTPGQNYTGTHGCVNVPPDVARQLYAWAQIGTVVQVMP